MFFQIIANPAYSSQTIYRIFLVTQPLNLLSGVETFDGMFRAQTLKMGFHLLIQNALSRLRVAFGLYQRRYLSIK
jgi:hypothetical protein